MGFEEFRIMELADLNLLTGMTLFVVFLLVVNYLRSRETTKRLPPGPIGLPLLGYLPFIGKDPHKTLASLGDKYGPVISLMLGNRLTIVLNNYNSINEAFVKQGNIFAGRPVNNIFTSKGKEQVLSGGDGPLWKTHRIFAFHTLKNLGFGKTSIEPLIKDQIEVFLKIIHRFNGEPENVSVLLRNSISNNICVLIFGKAFDLADPIFLKMNYLVDERIKRYDNINIRLCLPWLKRIPFLGNQTGQNKSVALQENLLEVVRQVITKYKEENVEYDNSYVGSYLTEQARLREIDPNDNTFDDEKLEGNVVVLLGAGSDSLTITMAWAMRYLMLYPEVQQRIHEELDQVIGRERTPCWEDRKLLPYTNAVMLEILRLSSVLPLSIAHSCVRKTELLGYTIPERADVLPNMWKVHHDPELWGDPENFRPERFIDNEGKVLNSPYLMPFSLGPRTCLGLDMARMEYFLYFSMLLQKFSLRKNLNVNTFINLDYYQGFSMRPTPFETRFVPR